MSSLQNIDEAFVHALLNEDEVGSVIRVHLHIERQINNFLELAVQRPEYLARLNLTYAKKVELACCLWFDAKFLGALKKIGSLRNDFAHDLGTKITKESVKDLFCTLPEFGQESVKLSITMMREYPALARLPASYDLLSPKQQFIFISLNLERICCALYELLKDAKRASV